jgi:hypothetical protein
MAASYTVPPTSVREPIHGQRWMQHKARVGRVGLEPTTGGYEKHGPVHRTHYLHGYHGAVPPMTLIAPLAQVARSTNRSTHSIVITGCRYRTLLPTGRLVAMGPARCK